MVLNTETSGKMATSLVCYVVYIIYLLMVIIRLSHYREFSFISAKNQ